MLSIFDTSLVSQPYPAEQILLFTPEAMILTLEQPLVQNAAPLTTNIS